MMLEPQLKPCPFCGGEAKAFVGQHAFTAIIIRCDNCEAEGPLFDEEGENAERINSIAAALHWNTRA